MTRRSVFEPDDRAVLADSALFRGVAFESIEGLLERCPVQNLPAHAVLLSPGQDNRSVYVLLDGELEVRLGGAPDGPCVKMRTGDCVGELSLIDGQRPSALVTAPAPVRVMVIGPEVLWPLVDVSHAIARNMLYVLSGRMRQENRALVESLRARHVLERAVSMDALTGVHNRGWMDETFARHLARVARDGAPASLLLVDIDHFKAFNDRHGHLAGDAALVAVARVLRDSLRPGDLLARYGGEEFAALLPGAREPDAVETAERLRRNIAEAEMKEAGGGELPRVTVSVGVAEARAGDDLAGVLDRADQALYRAKDAGRNAVRT